MITVKHRTASGALDRMWEHDPARGCIIVVLPGACLTIPVCTSAAPRHGAYHIVRLSEDCWRIAPAMFVRRGSVWNTTPHAYPDSHVDEFIALTSAPEDVRAELEEL